MAAGIVVVFDFDKTIINYDSDDWVIDHLGGTSRFQELLLTMPWNSAVVKIMDELNAQARFIEEILKRGPLHPSTIAMIKSAYYLGCDLRIVSDANQFFIETILRHYGLFEFFTEINTNPSYIDEDGMLRILPYHDLSNSCHGCSLCPPNMCKSKIIERIQASAFAEGKKQFIYLGDGKGDFCPSLKLREVDCVMPRKNYPMWELIRANMQLVKAKIHEWSDAEEQARVLLQLINKLISAERNFASQWKDCLFQTVPVVSLPVRN